MQPEMLEYFKEVNNHSAIKDLVKEGYSDEASISMVSLSVNIAKYCNYANIAR